MKTKTLIYVAVGGVGLYFLYFYLRWMKDQAAMVKTCDGEFAVQCNDGSCDVSNGVVAPCLNRGGVKMKK